MVIKGGSGHIPPFANRSSLMAALYISPDVSAVPSILPFRT